MLNLLAGGGMTHMSLFAVGVGPYITAQIITQLLSSDLIPALSRMAKNGDRGRKKLEIITRFLTLPFCIAQGYAILALILNNNSSSGSDQISIFGHTALNELTAGEIIELITIYTGGTYICIYIGDMITKRGVGNGITLLILSGILSSFISNFVVSFAKIESIIPNNNNSIHLLSVVLSCIVYSLLFVGILLAIIFINNSIRKIPIQQTGQALTSKTEELSFLPIKINSAGVIPVIFASSIMTIPGTIAQFLPQSNGAKTFISDYITTESWSGMAIYFVLIILFTFFYSYVQINPQRLSENFDKSGRFILGVKSGKDTEKYITTILARVN
jgi:preprotein translocase subunit SecY